MDIDINFTPASAPLGVVTLGISVEDFYGLRHGFTGQGVFAPKVSVPEARQKLATVMPDLRIALPEQSHSDVVVPVLENMTNEHCVGDALFYKRSQGSGIVLGIRTADCVPLLIASADAVALIHAGWRGLANRIIEKTLAHFDSVAPITVLIGPCGGRNTYEVGSDVFEAIGDTVVAEPVSQEKYLLDMPAVAAAQIRARFPHAMIFSSGVCTISDSRFHSYRRDGEKSGRNLSFIVV